MLVYLGLGRSSPGAEINSGDTLTPNKPCPSGVGLSDSLRGRVPEGGLTVAAGVNGQGAPVPRIARIRRVSVPVLALLQDRAEADNR